MSTIKERYDANQIITTVEGTDLIPAQKSSDVAGKVLTANTLKEYITPSSTITGDMIRWNDSTESWEVCQEPFEFKGIVLTPALASLIEAEGAMYYNSTQKAVLVCTDI